MLRICQLVPEWELALQAENKAPKTIRLYLDNLKRFLAVTGDKLLTEVTRADVRQYLNARREQDLSAYTINQDFRSLRTFFHWCQRENYLIESPIDGMIAPSLPQQLPRALGAKQIQQLFKTAKQSHSPKRNELIIRFMLDTGIRLSELAALDMADVDLEQGIAIIRQGKGHKDRHVPLGAKLRLCIHRYLRDCRQAHAGESALLIGKGGSRLSARGLQSLIIRLGQRLGFRVHPHMLRHTFATEWLRNGGDLESLRRILGHTSLSTTQIYLHLLEEDLIEAHRSFSPGDKY